MILNFVVLKLIIIADVNLDIYALALQLVMFISFLTQTSLKRNLRYAQYIHENTIIDIKSNESQNVIYNVKS